jgi:hypothetical protein
MNERMPIPRERMQSEPVKGITQKMYNETQINLMKEYGAVRWIEEGMAKLYGEYAKENPNQILAASAGDLEIDDLLKQMRSKKEIH